MAWLGVIFLWSFVLETHPLDGAKQWKELAQGTR